MYSDEIANLLFQKIDVDNQYQYLKDAAAKTRFVLEKTGELKDLPQVPKMFQPKDDSAALVARKCGNDCFIKDKDYVSALKYYNRSMCLATEGSEHLAIGYANRSAVYLNSGFYKLCLENIELAMKHNYPAKLRPKLVQRKKECLELMNNHVDGLDKFNKEKMEVKLSYKANAHRPMIDGLELATSELFGRYIRTKRDLYPGDVIIIEKPFSKCLQSGSEYNRCTNCLKENYLNLFPCGQCTRAMFCSKDCHQEAWNHFHKYECKIIDELFALVNVNMRIAIRTTLYSFTMFDEPEHLQKLIEDIDVDLDVDTESGFDLDYTCLTKEKHFRAIYALATHEAQRNAGNLFVYTNLCAIAWKLLSNYTDLNLMLKTKDMEDFFLNTMFHFMLSASINFHALACPKNFGDGSFALCSLLNHSCAPNVVRTYEGDTMVVLVNRIIKRGGQIFDSYGQQETNHNYASLNERKKLLRDHYLFDCKCEACVHKYPLFDELPIHMKYYQFVLNDTDRIKSYDMAFAQQKFEEYKKFLKDNDSKYPSWEVILTQENLVDAFDILSVDMPLDKQLKPMKE